MFSSISGLNPNIFKSTVFFGNVKHQVRQEILSLLPFKIGNLPASYLGVPLITKHISYTDCKNLIDKVKLKVSDWKNRMLSYAGRLQLIASILSSMQVYWASVFIISKSVIKDINKLLKGFLWCQGELSNGKAKVAWKNVCRPKNEGGLGIKDLGQWNEVLMAKHLWNIASMKESLWVKWINVFRLKGERIWDVDCEKNSSYGWKQILSLRNKMRNHIISVPVPNFDQVVKNVILWETKGASDQNSLPDRWDDIISTLANQKHNKSIKSVLRRLTLAACVYYILQERNKRIFTSDKKKSNELVAEIFNHLRLKLASLTVKRTAQVVEVSKKWKVKMNTKDGSGSIMESMSIEDV
ncbi:hypothetical protein Tco_1271280 [Tanacetum coccineum]